MKRTACRNGKVGPGASRWSVLALGLSLVGLVSGCSGVRAPGFRVVSVTETERSAEAVVLGFTLEVENTNDVALPLERASYSLTLDGQRVFRGSRVAGVTAPRFGRQRLELPVVVPASLVPAERFDQAGEMPYVLGGEVEYQTPGRLAEFLFDINLRRPTAALGLTGTLNLPGGTAMPSGASDAVSN
ncbi:MAG: LEA type 2 family protein [Phycisphaeraceae bacterium]|nr:MAG: LEA type 2 family protein [Phycisphaeraceae bacterium]